MRKSRCILAGLAVVAVAAGVAYFLGWFSKDPGPAPIRPKFSTIYVPVDPVLKEPPSEQLPTFDELLHAAIDFVKNAEQEAIKTGRIFDESDLREFCSKGMDYPDVFCAIYEDRRGMSEFARAWAICAIGLTGGETYNEYLITAYRYEDAEVMRLSILTAMLGIDSSLSIQFSALCDSAYLSVSCSKLGKSIMDSQDVKSYDAIKACCYEEARRLKQGTNDWFMVIAVISECVKDYPDLISMLVVALNDEGTSLRLREKIGQLMAESFPPSSFERVYETVRAFPLDVRPGSYHPAMVSARALAAMYNRSSDHDPKLAGYLHELLVKGNPFLRAELISVLGAQSLCEIYMQDSTQVFQALFTDASFDVRISTLVRFFGEMHDPFVMDMVCNAISSERDEARRYELINEINSLDRFTFPMDHNKPVDYSRFLGLMEQIALSDESYETRLLAVKILGYHRYESALGTLKAIAVDNSLGILAEEASIAVKDITGILIEDSELNDGANKFSMTDDPLVKSDLIYLAEAWLESDDDPLEVRCVYVSGLDAADPLERRLLESCIINNPLIKIRAEAMHRLYFTGTLTIEESRAILVNALSFPGLSVNADHLMCELLEKVNEDWWPEGHIDFKEGAFFGTLPAYKSPIRVYGLAMEGEIVGTALRFLEDANSPEARKAALSFLGYQKFSDSARAEVERRIKEFEKKGSAAGIEDEIRSTLESIQYNNEMLKLR